MGQWPSLVRDETQTRVSAVSIYKYSTERLVTEESSEVTVYPHYVRLRVADKHRASFPPNPSTPPTEQHIRFGSNDHFVSVVQSCRCRGGEDSWYRENNKAREARQSTGYEHFECINPVHHPNSVKHRRYFHTSGYSVEQGTRLDAGLHRQVRLSHMQ